MSFIDEVVIEVISGDGGHGCLSFRRERCVPYGGPDGGNGGNGGDVYLKATEDINNLLPFRYKKKFKAESGQSGSGRDKHGKNAEDLIVNVPVGTKVYVEDSGLLLTDLSKPGQRFLVAQSGQGGLGNVHFKSSTNRAPRQTTKGGKGERLTLKLELSLLADIGLLGQPNAGKSTLLRSVSAATPKVADYPFTTTRPYLGVIHIEGDYGLVMADIPGLIKGAAEGSGLGTLFLKHLSRCGALLHIIDGQLREREMLEAYRDIRDEVKAYGRGIDQKPEQVVLNKKDMVDEIEIERKRKALSLEVGHEVICISAMKKQGIQYLFPWMRQWCMPNLSQKKK